MTTAPVSAVTDSAEIFAVWEPTITSLCIFFCIRGREKTLHRIERCHASASARYGDRPVVIMGREIKGLRVLVFLVFDYTRSGVAVEGFFLRFDIDTLL